MNNKQIFNDIVKSLNESNMDSNSSNSNVDPSLVSDGTGHNVKKCIDSAIKTKYKDFSIMTFDRRNDFLFLIYDEKGNFTGKKATSTFSNVGMNRAKQIVDEIVKDYTAEFDPSKFDAKQKKALKNVKHAVGNIIGGLENQMSDSPSGSPEHECAKKQLADHAGLVDTIYSEATNAVFDVGFAGHGSSSKSYINDIKFCGKEFIMGLVERYVKAAGY